MIGQPVDRVSGQTDIGDFFEDSPDDAVAQRLDVCRSFLTLLVRQPESLGKADDIRHVLGSSTQLKLLPPAGLGWDERRPLADVERADPLRPIELVRAEREHVHAERVHIHR